MSLNNRFQRFLVIILFVTSCFELSGQGKKDTLHVNWFFNLQGQVQTGNLNMVGGGAISKLFLNNSVLGTEFYAKYTIAKIEGFTIINDLWTYSLLKLKHNRRFYPLGIGYFGTGKSFHITRAVVAGLVVVLI